MKDLSYILRWEKEPKNPPAQGQLFVQLKPEEELLMKTISAKPKAIHLESLSEETGLTPGKCLQNLMTLEINGLIEALPGKMFKALR
jgi:DNA processing protein